MHLELTAGRVEVVFLNGRDAIAAFTAATYEGPAFDEFLTLDTYTDEKRDTESVLHDALAKRWVPVDDFEVGRDGNVAFTLCGGVYSHRIICRDYLDILHRILRTTRDRERWAYSTDVELQQPLDGLTLGGFVLQRDRITVDDWDGWDEARFLRYFSRSADEAMLEASSAR